MDNFDLRKYLTEGRLLKEDNLRDYWPEWAAGEVEVGNDDIIDAGGVDAEFEKVSDEALRQRIFESMDEGACLACEG